MVGPVRPEGRRADNHAVGALFHQLFRPLRRPHPAAHPAPGPGAQRFDNCIVLPAAQRRVEIDHLNLGKSGEPLKHHLRRIALKRLLFSLHQLNDFAVHQINTG
jgi:hypothetical protein